MKFKYKDQIVTASSKKDAIKKIVGYYNYLNDEFLEGFLRTALEVGGVRTKDMNEEDESDTESYSVKDFNTATINKAKKICDKFKMAMKAELNEAYNKGKTETVAGACLYVTSGGFANGFMEKGFPKAKELDLEANKPAYAGFENLTLSKDKIVTASSKVEAVKKIKNSETEEILYESILTIENDCEQISDKEFIASVIDSDEENIPDTFETEVIKKAIIANRAAAKKCLDKIKEYHVLNEQVVKLINDRDKELGFQDYHK